MRVRYSRPALADLDAILSDLAQKNPAAAARFEPRIAQIEERIGRFPEAFQHVESRPDYRRVPLYRYPYLLFYTLAADEVVVLRIMHGARKEPWEDL
jgi:plasmid stabilization system protein ParE